VQLLAHLKILHLPEMLHLLFCWFCCWDVFAGFCLYSFCYMQCML